MHRVIRHTVLLGVLACWWMPSAIADPSALWHIVHDRCVPHQERFQAPFPCLETDEHDGIALLKDLVGQTQTLLIPTARITGVEDPAVLDPAAPNYFQLAWRRIGMTRALADTDLPRDAISLALNSEYGRTQNQLHIHIDCLLPDIRARLAEYAGAITRSWTTFPTLLAGHTYLARRVWTLDRPGANPFQLVADGVAGARADMAAVTIVVAGATFDGEPGFIVLAGRADLAADNRGSGEELQDHRCALAHPH